MKITDSDLFTTNGFNESTFIYHSKQGDEFHYKNGYLIYVKYADTGNQFWYCGSHPNVLHRLEGPAIIYGQNQILEGYKAQQFWWLEGKQLDCQTQEEFERYMKMKAFW